MVIKKPHQINWKRGAGEFISYTFSVIALVFLFLIIISFMVLNNANGKIETAVTVVSRDVVVCENMEQAQAQAQKEAKLYLKNCSNVTDVKAEVGYAGGSNQGWQKGNFIEVTVSGYVKTCDPFTSGRKSSSMTIMIERNGGS